jgi:hypothetical protein
MNRREFGAAVLGAAVLGALPRGARGAAPAARVNGARLNAHMEAIGRFGRNAGGGIDRVAYSDADREARA